MPNISILVAWAAVLACIGIACILKRDARLNRVFIVAVSLFVAQSLVSAAIRDGRIGRGTPVMDSDRAELLLRFGTSLSVLEKSMSAVAPARPEKPARDVKDFHQEAATVLEEAISRSPDASALKVKLAIVLGDSGKPAARRQVESIARELSRRVDEKDKNMGLALRSLYLPAPGAEIDLTGLKRQIESYCPPGWYRDAALMRLYKVAGEKARLEELSGRVDEHGLRLFVNLLCLMAVGLVASLVGIVLVVVQLFTLARNQAPSGDESGGSHAVPWGLSVAYAVLVLWFATQILVGAAAQQATRSMHLMALGPLVAALTTAVLYLISNGPGVLYAYFIAFKPAGMRFLDGIRLRCRTERAGPARLVFAGIGTWCVAVPAVMVAYLLASKFLGAQGSSNPIIGLVLEAARSSNHMATLTFYFTLGVLAPFCEESLFRGFLYRTLRKKFGIGLSLFVSAALFSVAHMDAGAVLPLLCLGWLFGYVFERTRSLLPSMIAHGMWNSGTFTLVLLIFGS